MTYDFYADRKELESDVQDFYARIQLSANDMLGKDSAKQGHNVRFKGEYAAYISQQLRDFRCLLTRDLSSAIDYLPDGAMSLQCQVQLARPFLSIDDTAYYICDNPLRKERVFRLPEMPATGWKGALRAAAVRLLARDSEALTATAFAERRFRLTKLFGTEKDDADRESFLDDVGGGDAATRYRQLYEGHAKDGHIAGRLRFFATFFDRVGVEVINPHDRRKRAGKYPIFFEAAAVDAKGTFKLLYVPFDLVGRPSHQILSETSADIGLLGPAVIAMLTEYGFGGKTSSGYGVASDELAGAGQLVLKVKDPLHEEPAEQSSDQGKNEKLRRYWKAENQLRDEFLDANGELISENRYAEYVTSLGQQYTEPNKRLYAKARKWWQREGRALAQQPVEEHAPEAEEPPQEQWIEREFGSLAEMVTVMSDVADMLLTGPKEAGDA